MSISSEMWSAVICYLSVVVRHVFGLLRDSRQTKQIQHENVNLPQHIAELFWKMVSAAVARASRRRRGVVRTHNTTRTVI